MQTEMLSRSRVLISHFFKHQKTALQRSIKINKINYLKFRRSRKLCSFKESNKKQKKNNQYYSINNSYFDIPICQVNLFGSLVHNTPLIKYASIKLTIPKIKLTVNKTSLVFLFSILMGKITAAPTQPAPKFIKKSAKIPKAVLSIFLSYVHSWLLSIQQLNNRTIEQFIFFTFELVKFIVLASLRIATYPSLIQKASYSFEITQEGFIKFSKHTLISYLIVSTVLVGSGIIFLFNPFGGGPKQAQATWFNDNWGYRQRIDLTVITNASDISNLDTLLTIDTTGITASLQTNCEDLRFTDTNGNILSYFIDTCTDNSATNKVWVRANLVPKDTTTYTIYMYYGNSSASAKSDSSMFNLYNGLKGYWTMNEAAGDTCASGGDNCNSATSGNDGVWTNQAQSTTGNYSNGTIYDGTNDVTRVTEYSGVDVGALADSYTVSAWVKYTVASTGINRFLVAKQGPSTTNFPFTLRTQNGSDHAVFETSGDGGTFDAAEGSTALNNNVWHFLVGVRDRNTDLIYIYVDGVLEATDSDGATGSFANNDNLSFGNGGGASYIAQDFNGAIDDVRIYNRALSQSEITQLKNSPGTITTTATGTSKPTTSFATEEKAPSPIGYWKFDDAQGTTAQDSMAGNNDGTLSNFASPPSAISSWQTEDQCISSKCLAFDKANDSVSAGSAAVLDDIATTTGQDLTAEAWINPKSTGEGGSSGGVIMGKATGPTGGDANGSLANGWVLFMTTSNSLVFKVDAATTDLRRTTNTTAGNTVALNSWNHVVVTWDGSSTATNVHIYINGTEANSYSTSQDSSGAIASDATPSLLIGNDSTGADTFDGRIDEVKIFNSAHSASQVLADFNARSNPEGVSQQQGNNTQNMPAALSNGLVGYWKMDETSAWATDCSTKSVLDSSGNANNGAPCPSGGSPATQTLTSKFGQAADVDGTNDYINVSSSSTLDLAKYTLSFWMNADAASDTGAIEQVVNKGVDGVSGAANYQFNWRHTTVGFPKSCSHSTGNTFPTQAQIVSTMNISTWYHVTCTYDGTNIKAYLNGKLEATSALGAPDTGSQPLYLGSGQANGAATNYYNGKVDEIRVYNRALSNNEVAQLYNWAPGPVGYWKLDERTGTTAFDSSGNANNSSAFSGAPAWQTGKYGSALNFNGTADYLTINTSGSLDTKSQITLEAWINPAGSSTQPIFEYNNATNVGVHFWQYDAFSKLYANFVDSGGTDHIVSANGIAASLTAGTWSHVAATYNGSTGKIFVNGKELVSTSLGSFTLQTSYNLGIARRLSAANYYNGNIDEAKIYNYARTQGQIIEDMNAGHPAPGSPIGTPVGYWKFNEGAANTCSGGSNDACNSGSGGSTYDGAFNNNTGYSNSGKFGKAGSFDGTDDYVQVTGLMGLDTSPAQQVTLTGWVNLTSADTNGSDFISIGDYLLIRLDDDLASNVPRGYYYKGSSAWNAIASNGSSVAGTGWHHYAYVVDPTNATQSLYIDGLLRGSGTNTDAIVYSGQGSNTFIGRHGNAGTTRDVNGLIDDVKVYAQALTADQVKLDMNQASTEVLGALSDKSGNQVNSAANEYCIPGDSTACTAPVGRWDLEEGTGTTANDTSGNANTGTITAGSGGYTTGKPGKAYNFDKASTKIDAGSGTTLDDIATTGSQDLTAEAWVYPKSTGEGGASGGVIFGKATGPTGGNANGTLANGWVLFMTTSNSLVFKSDEATTDLRRVTDTTAGNTLTLNTWSHVAVTWTGSITATTVHIYINGNEANSYATSQDGSGAINSDATPTFIIGNDSTSADTFDGYIDNVRVFQYARSAAQIAWDMNRGAPVGYWKMDECQGTTINDSSGNSYTGTLTVGASGSEDTIGTCTTTSTSWLKGVTGKRNYSMSLDGTDDYIQVSDTANLRFDAATQDFSLFAWVKRTTTGTEYIISKEDADNDGWRMMFDSNNNIVCSEDATDVSSTSAISDTNWHLIGCSISRAGNGQVYIDGRADGTATAMGSDAMATTSNIRIGTRSYTSTSYFNGQIDDTRVYNYALTATQVKALTNEGAVRYGPVTGAP